MLYSINTSKCWGVKNMLGCTNEVGGCAPPRKSASVPPLPLKQSNFAVSYTREIYIFQLLMARMQPWFGRNFGAI